MDKSIVWENSCLQYGLVYFYHSTGTQYRLVISEHTKKTKLNTVVSTYESGKAFFVSKPYFNLDECIFSTNHVLDEYIKECNDYNELEKNNFNSLSDKEQDCLVISITAFKQIFDELLQLKRYNHYKDVADNCPKDVWTTLRKNSYYLNNTGKRLQKATIHNIVKNLDLAEYEQNNVVVPFA